MELRNSYEKAHFEIVWPKDKLQQDAKNNLMLPNKQMLTVQPCARMHAHTHIHKNSHVLAMMPCRQVYSHWRSRGTCGLHVQFGPKLDFTSVSTLKTASSSRVLVWTCDTIQCQNQQDYWTLPSTLLNYRRIINILIFTTVQSFVCHTANTYSSPKPILISQVTAVIFCKKLHVLALILLKCTF
jgi:hypothetical protein